MKRVDHTAAPGYVDGVEDLFKGWNDSAHDPEIFRAEPLNKAAPEGVSEAKYKRCKEDVEAQGGKYNPYAVCAASLQGKTRHKKSEGMEKKYEGFKAVEENARRSGADNPAAVAAAAGREKYGKKKFQEAAAAGKKMKGMHHKKSEMEKASLHMENESDPEREAFRGAPRTEGGDVLSLVSRKMREKLQELMGEKKEEAVYTKSELKPGMSYKMLKADHDRHKDMPPEEAKNIIQSPHWDVHEMMPMVHPEKRDDVMNALKDK